jgi:hypothetical protein
VTVFIRNKSRVFFFYNFPKYHLKILPGDFNTKVGLENISNRQLGIRVCMKVLMIMALE